MLEHQKAEVDSTVSLTNHKYTVPDKVFAAILELDRQAKLLRKQRMKKGAISFDRVEVNFNLNQDNKPDSVFFKSSKDANKLIEEFMLLANRKVAAFIGSQQKNSLLSIVSMMIQMSKN